VIAKAHAWLLEEPSLFRSVPSVPGTFIITVFVGICGDLVYLRIVSGDALLFFMGSVVGYLFA